MSQGTAKKVTVALDGVIVGTRRNTREYTHAVVNTSGKEVISYHLTETAAIDKANKYRMQGASYVTVLPTTIELKPRFECLNKDIVSGNVVIVTEDPYIAARYFFGDIARKKYGKCANVRDITYVALGGPRCMGIQYRAFIGDVVGNGENEVVVQGEYCEITVQDTRCSKSDAEAA